MHDSREMPHWLRMAEPPEAPQLPPLRFRIVSQVDGTTTHATVSGEIDIATADTVEHQLLIARDQHESLDLVVDLRAVTFMDSSGLRLLVSLAQDGRKQRYRVVFVRPPAHIHRTIELAGLDRVLSFVDEPDAAGRARGAVR